LLARSGANNSPAVTHAANTSAARHASGVRSADLDANSIEERPCSAGKVGGGALAPLLAVVSRFTDTV
jgi:hypothetical protein